MPLNSHQGAKKFILGVLALFLVSSFASLFLSLRSTDSQYEQLAAAVGRSYFRAIVATRQWNAEHGGVYVVVNDRVQPNMLLNDPLRDLVTASGLRLTKINPAMMTRQISDLLNQGDDLRIRITSLKPIRPENSADIWEIEALTGFEKGNLEHFGLEATGESSVYRYMAPLFVVAECLDCHAKQGYRVGDVRGGISVTFPYAPFLAAIGSAKRQTMHVHLFIGVVGILVILLLGKKLVDNIGMLQNSIARIRKLEGLLPICAACKKIRKEETDPADQTSWIPVETFIRDRTDAEFSHGICPECLKKMYPDFAGKKSGAL